MGKVWSKSEIKVTTNAPSYSPGEELSGQISLYLTKTLSQATLNVTILGSESFSLSASNTANSQSRTLDCLRYSVIVYDSNLKKGQYAFPFFFVLPKQLPSTFHATSRGYQAHVAYFIKVELRQAGLVSEIEVNIVNSGPNGTQPVRREESFPVVTCCFLPSVLRVTAFLDKAEYWQGDRLNFTMGINTSESRRGVREICIDLIRIVRLKTRISGLKTFMELVKGYKVTKAIPALHTDVEKDIIEANFSLEELDIVGCNSTDGSLIECGFSMNARIHTGEGYCTDGQEFVCNVPVIIHGGPIPSIYIPPYPSEWRPSIMERTHISLPPEFAPSAPSEDEQH